MRDCLGLLEMWSECVIKRRNAPHSRRFANFDTSTCLAAAFGVRRIPPLSGKPLWTVLAGAGPDPLQLSRFTRSLPLLASWPAIVAIVCGLMLLAGCAVGPDYHHPTALGTNTIPQSFSGSAETNGIRWGLANPAANLPRGRWWGIFEDQTLNRLEIEATANNQDVAAALARHDEALASFDISRSEFFPQVSFDPSFARQRTSFNEPQNGVAALNSHTYNTFTLALQAGWEADLWGRIRRQVESARANIAASADDLESARLGVQADLATDYFLFRAVDAERALLERTAEAFRHSLQLTVNRRKGGAASDLDVSQAETQLRTTEAEIPALDLQRSRLLHAMATLTGHPATGFELEHAGTERRAHTPGIPVYLPSELLERRPDIAASERRVAAANAEIGVAQSAFYPRLRFNGLAGIESISASTLFDWPSRVWSFGPSIDLPIFTGGRNRAELAFSRATYRERVANYRQTTLNAFQEVEDQLAAQQYLEQQLQAQVSALSSAQHTLEVANNRYKAGLITYLEVVTSQSAALNVERSVVQLEGQTLVASVALVKALGGGWSAGEAAQAAQ